MASTDPQQQPSLISATLPGETTPDVADAEKQSPKARSSWLTELKRDVSLNHTDIPVIASCFSSGLCDSSAFNAWNTFVSMQTGNTIILALGASGQPVSQPYIWLKSLTAIVFFLVGCYFFAQSRRTTRTAASPSPPTFLVQAILIFVAAALVQRHVVPSPSGYHELDPGRVAFIELLPIGFLASASGGESVTVRTWGLM
ncbi:hypothetical protein VE04_01086, partial [Pseudogymnoascus sp. 24MN13]